MCGILGTVNFNNTFKLTRPWLETLRDTMHHRGPDGAGTWINPKGTVGLAHRRLSIIDLSTAANQPMTTADKSISTVFNGEIYNHAEIRKDLEALGKFKWATTHSDTEVLLHAYAEWGMGCLSRLRGMFAFAIWDERKQQLFLARDRVGIKPLYYTTHHNRFMFASEIKALLADTELKREVNEEAFFHYLSFLVTPAPMTLFKGIHKLPAGCWMEVKADGTTKTHRYWDALEAATPIEPSMIPNHETAAQAVQNKLREAVRYRKVSDVPVGVFLSGGIDSSTNAALFSEGEEAGKVKTFAIGYDKEYKSCPSELPFAKQMAEHIESTHHEIKLSQQDMLDFLPHMIALQDEPIADPTCTPIYYLAKAAREAGVIVAQAGEGGDELFMGYPDWKKFYKLERYNRLPVPKFFKKCLLKALILSGRGNRFYTEYLRRGMEKKPIFWGGAEAFGHREKMQLLSPRLRDYFAGRTSWEVIEPIHDRFMAQHPQKCTILNWMSYLDLNVRLPEQLLMRTDKMTMGVSLEARVPFLDHTLVEFVLGLPDDVRFHKQELKYILKKAVRGLVPENLLQRKKQGLGMPLYEWFFSEYGETAKAILLDFCRRSDLLDEKAVLSLWAQKRGQHAWYLLNAALWWKHYIMQEDINFLTEEKENDGVRKKCA